MCQIHWEHPVTLLCYSTILNRLESSQLAAGICTLKPTTQLLFVKVTGITLTQIFRIKHVST